MPGKMMRGNKATTTKTPKPKKMARGGMTKMARGGKVKMARGGKAKK